MEVTRGPEKLVSTARSERRWRPPMTNLPPHAAVESARSHQPRQAQGGGRGGRRRQQKGKGQPGGGRGRGLAACKAAHTVDL